MLVAPETRVTGTRLPYSYWELRQHDVDVQFLSITANIDGPLGEGFGALNRLPTKNETQKSTTPSQIFDDTRNTPNPRNNLPNCCENECSLQESRSKKLPQEKRGLVRFDKSAVHLSPRNTGDKKRDCIWIENLSSKALVFKVMVTNVQEFAIRPCYGMVLEGEKTALEVQMRKGTERDRILVKVASATTHETGDLREFWKQVNPEEVSKFTFHVKICEFFHGRDKHSN